MYKFNKTLVLRLLSLSYVIGFILVVSCSSRRDTKDKRVVKDDLGREVNVPEQPVRIMALSSSLTEMLYAICEEENIVGRTHNCNYPPQVLSKPVVNNYPIDYERLLLLKPDLVLAKEGIVSMEEAAKIQGMGIPVYFQNYHGTEDVFSGLIKLGAVLKREERAAYVVDSLKLELEKIIKSTKGLLKPSVLMIISKEKIFVYGKDSYASDMIEKAGGRNAVDSIFQHAFPSLTTEYIMHINPDVLIAAEQVDLDNSFFNMYPELKKINAYKNHRLYTVSEELISRPGPRVTQAIDMLKKAIHPDAK